MKSRLPALAIVAVLAAGAVVMPAAAASGAAVGDYVFDHKWGSTLSAVPAQAGDTAVDSAGNVFVIEANTNRILKYDSTGHYLTQWGSQGSALGQFQEPTGIDVDPSGNVFVVDNGNDRVQKFSNAGAFISTFGSSGPGGMGQFDSAQGVAVASNGDVWVADQAKHRVSKFSNSGTWLVDIGGSYSTADGGFAGPYALAVGASNRLFVADRGNHRIEAFNPAGEYLYKFGTEGTANGEFSFPSQIDTDSVGNVYVGDTNNNRVQKFSSAGSFTALWLKPSGGANFVGLKGISLDALGNILTSDSENGTVSRITVNSSTPWQLTAAPNGGKFSQPYGSAVDSAGNVYVTDSQNARVQKFAPDGSLLLQWGARGNNNGEFDIAGDIALDNFGHVFVSDLTGDRVQRFSTSGEYQLQWGSNGTGDGQFKQSFGLAVDSAGNVYVTDVVGHRVQKFSNNGTFISTWGNEGTGDGEFALPAGIAVDSAGDVWVSDLSLNRVQKFHTFNTTDYLYTSKFGSAGSAVGQLTSPIGLQFDAAGDLWVADAGNHRVQKFSSAGVAITSIGTGGVGDGQFTTPVDISFAPDGTAFVPDFDQDRVQAFKKATQPVIVGSVTTTARVGSPYSSAVSATGYPAPTLSVSGALPAGLGFDPATGVLSGIPTSSGVSTFSIIATSAQSSSSQNVTITVAKGAFARVAAPVISGTPAIGKSLTVSPGNWSPAASFTQQWTRSGTPITGATGATYKLTKGDLNKKVGVIVTGTSANEESQSLPSAAVTAKYGFTKAATPKITGTAKVGNTLKVSIGKWSPKAKTTVKWYRNGVAIKKATKSSYTLTKADKGKKITVKVTGTKKDYLTTGKTSKTTGPVKK